MRKSQFSHTQIANILKEFEQGKSVEEIHRDPHMVYRKKNKPSTGLLSATATSFLQAGLMNQRKIILIKRTQNEEPSLCK